MVFFGGENEGFWGEIRLNSDKVVHYSVNRGWKMTYDIKALNKRIFVCLFFFQSDFNLSLYNF